MWAFIVKCLYLQDGVISTLVTPGVIDDVILMNLPDYCDRLSIRYHRHVFFDPALRRGLPAAQASPAFAKIVLCEGGW